MLKVCKVDCTATLDSVIANGLVQISGLLYMIKHTDAIGGNMDPKGHSGFIYGVKAV